MTPMSLEKAIELLDLNLKVAGKSMPPDVKDALALAIAALHSILAQRQDPTIPPHTLLPNEKYDQDNLI